MGSARVLGSLALMSAMAGVAGAAVTLPDVEFDNAAYFEIRHGTRSGVHAVRADGDGGVLPPTTGTLHRRDNGTVGRFTVVYASETDAVARVDELAAGLSLAAVDHAAIRDSSLVHLSVIPLDSGRYFRVKVGWNDVDPDVLKHGAKGVLRTHDGGVAGQFSIVGVGPNDSIGVVTEYSPGRFARDVARAEIRGVVMQVVASSGIANLSWLNVVMLVIGCLFIYLAIAREYEPLLLVPIGFGILIGNIPLPLQIFNSISVYMIDPVTHEYAFNTTSNSVMGMIYFGVRAGIFPPLIFLGIGAMTEFSALLSNPRAYFWAPRRRQVFSSRSWVRWRSVFHLRRPPPSASSAAPTGRRRSFSPRASPPP